MKVRIDWDERYPDYTPDASPNYVGGVEIELSEQDLAEWEKACEKYDEWQGRIGKLVKEAREK